MANKAPAVFDEASLARQRKASQAEAHHEILKLSVAAIKDTERYIRDNHLDDFDKQKGKELTAEVWEARVKKLFPNVFFCTRSNYDAAERRTLNLPDGVNVRIMGFMAPDGFQYLFSYMDLPVLHEWTLIRTKQERIAGTGQHFSVKDVPNMKYDPETDDWIADGPMPWENFAEVPMVPLYGWRTGLAKLVLSGLVSVDAVEREFGTPTDNATWALRMGKQVQHAPEVLV